MNMRNCPTALFCFCCNYLLLTAYLLPFFVTTFSDFLILLALYYPIHHIRHVLNNYVVRDELITFIDYHPFQRICNVQNNFLLVATLENCFFGCFIKQFTSKLKAQKQYFLFLNEISGD